MDKISCLNLKVKWFLESQKITFSILEHVKKILILFY